MRFGKLLVGMFLVPCIQFLVEGMDQLQESAWYKQDLKNQGNKFLRLLERENLTMYKRLGGGDEIEKQIHLIAKVLERFINLLLSLRSVEEFDKVHAALDALSKGDSIVEVDEKTFEKLQKSK